MVELAEEFSWMAGIRVARREGLFPDSAMLA
jgi:hypothetical protein